MKRLPVIDTVIGLVGLALAIVGLAGKWGMLISAIALALGLLLAAWAISRIAGEYGDPYKHLLYKWKIKILDEKGTNAIVSLAHLLKVRKRRVFSTGMWWSTFPNNLKTYIIYGNRSFRSEDRIEIDHSEPQKQGGGYSFELIHKLPLRRGQQVWTIYEFEMHNEYEKGNISDFFDSFRRIQKFVWQFQLPPERPAKRWYGSVDYSPHREDKFVLSEGNETTTEVVWEFDHTKKGVVYYLNIDW